MKEIIPCLPAACRRCGHTLHGDDPEPLRHQVQELPPIQLESTEYQLHRLTCPRCGQTPRGQFPPGVSTVAVGPRLQSLLALSSGAFRMSKRMIQTFCADVLRQPLSLGEICRLEHETADAVDEPVAEARAVVPTEPANGDEMPLRLGGRWVAWWVAVTSTVTVFCVLLSKGADAVRELVGTMY